MSNIKLFQDKKIRSVWNEEEQQWHFSVVDVVAALTDSTDSKQYIKRMRSRDETLSLNWGTICIPVQMIAQDGKRRKIQATNIRGLFSIVQAIPSPKAESFKLWLAQVGYERVQEIENPELTQERVTTEISQKEKPDTFTANKQVAQRGGNVAGAAREQVEKELGRSIISSENFLSDSDEKDDTLQLPFRVDDE